MFFKVRGPGDGCLDSVNLEVFGEVNLKSLSEGVVFFGFLWVHSGVEVFWVLLVWCDEGF